MIKLPDDGSLVIRNMLEHFKYFIIILIVSTNYIFVHLLDQWRNEGGLGCSTPPLEILKALQNRAKLNPIVKTVKSS